MWITLSEERLKFARERAKAAGVDDHVKFELIDYRDVRGHFDRIVSVGMFEHVGPPQYREFFRHCHNLLNEDGVMLLHTIGRLNEPGVTDAWTRKYIFRSEEHTSELQSLMRISYADLCLKKKNNTI